MTRILGPLVIIGAAILGACSSPPATTAPPPAASAASGGSEVLSRLQGSWRNPDRSYGTVVRGITISPAGEVSFEPPFDRRSAMMFDGVQGGALIFRAIFFNRADVCTPSDDPPQTLNCAFQETRGARPREGSYTLVRQPTR